MSHFQKSVDNLVNKLTKNNPPQNNTFNYSNNINIGYDNNKNYRRLGDYLVVYNNKKRPIIYRKILDR